MMMKKLLPILFFCGFINAQQAVAQSFVTQYDTTKQSASSSVNMSNNVTNKTSAGFTISWHVTASDFPADWLGEVGICDNNTCQYNLEPSLRLWNGTTGNTYTSSVYSPGVPGTFYFEMTLADTNTLGTHYMTVSLFGSGYGKTITFIVTHVPTGISIVAQNDDNIILYPNPVKNQLNINLNGNTDARTISVYNVIGSRVATYRVSGTSFSINTENMPLGVYFIKLLGDKGNLIATRRFIHQ